MYRRNRSMRQLPVTTARRNGIIDLCTFLHPLPAQDASSSMALACRLMPTFSSWTIEDGATVVGNTAGGSMTGMGGALLVSTLGRCDEHGRPQPRLSSWRLALDGTAVTDNTADGAGGAVAVRGPSGPDANGWPRRNVAVLAKRCSVTGNSALRPAGLGSDGSSGMGGAFLMWGVQQRAMSAAPNTTITTLDPSAGALGPAACRLFLGQGSVVRGNAASSHGGAAALGGCSLRADAVEFVNNTAGGGGGAVAVLPSSEVSLPNLRQSLTASRRDAVR